MRKLAVLILFLTGMSMAGALMVSGVVAPPDGPPRPGLDWEPEVPPMEVGLEATEEPRALEVGGDDLERRELTRATELGEAVDGPVLLVVDKERGLPVAGAEIAFVDSTKAREKQGMDPRGPISHPSELAERYGAIVLTGRDGRVRLPRITAWTIVIASHEDRFAWTRLNTGHADEVRMELEPDQTVALQVIDHNGLGREGVPLSVYRGTGWGKAQRLWQGESGAGGEVILRHFQFMRQRSGNGKRFAAALRMPLGEIAASEFTADPLPSEPVIVQLPATGQLHVSFVDSEGETVLAGGRLSFQVVRSDSDSPDLPLRQNFDRLSVSKAQGEPAFVVPFVGLGLELQPSFRLDGASRGYSKGDPLRGPTAPDEVARATIAIPSDHTFLSGILQDQSGNPVSGSRVTLELHSETERLAGASFVPTEDGWFEFGAQLNDKTPPFLLRIAPRTPQSTIGLLVELPRLKLGQHNDLGVLQLETLQVIARGTVVDELGKPVPGANVRLQRFQVRQRGRAMRRSPSGGGTVQVPDQTPTADWHRENLVRTKADEEGRFELLGKTVPGRLRLQAFQTGYMTGTSEELRVGQTVKLLLTRAGTLSGKVKVPEGLSRRSMSVRLRPRHAPDSAKGTSLRISEGVAAFRFRRLDVGVYDLEFTLRGFAEPVLQVLGLPIVAGENGNNPQLEGLDLTPYLHRFALRMVGVDGSIPQQGTVVARFRMTSGEMSTGAFLLKGGRAEFLSPESSLDITIMAEGFQPKQVHVLAGERDIYLDTSPTVVLLTPGLRGLLGPERNVVITLRSTAPTGLPNSMRSYDQLSGQSGRLDGRMLGGGTGNLGADDTVSVPVGTGGEYEVSMRTNDEGSKPVTLGTVQILLGSTAPIVVPVDRERIAAELGLGGR